jgi:hypothetical protein
LERENDMRKFILAVTMAAAAAATATAQATF